METNKEKWQKILAEWKTSGLGRRAYCLQNNIPTTTFDYWRRRIREEDQNTASKQLVKLPVILQQSTPSGFVLEFGKNLTLQIPPNYQREDLQRIVKDLAEITTCW